MNLGLAMKVNIKMNMKINMKMKMNMNFLTIGADLHMDQL